MRRNLKETKKFCDFFTPLKYLITINKYIECVVLTSNVIKESIEAHCTAAGL